MTEKIVCDCCGVKASIVQEYIDEYKAVDKSIDEIREDLGIGLGCGCCKFEGCEKIDISLEEMLNLK